MGGCGAKPQPKWKHIGIHDNQLKNPDFEMVNYYNIPNFWAVNNVQAYNKGAKSGKFCVRGHSYIKTNKGIIKQNFIFSKRGFDLQEIKKGVYSIRFGAYQKASSKSDETAKISITFFDKKGKFLGEVFAKDQKLTPHWTKVDAIAAIPPNAYKAQFNFFITKQNGSFEGPYLDDAFIYVVKKSTLTKAKTQIKQPTAVKATVAATTITTASVVQPKSKRDIALDSKKIKMAFAIDRKDLDLIKYKVEHGYDLKKGAFADSSQYKRYNRRYNQKNIEPNKTVIAYLLRNCIDGCHSTKNKEKTIKILKYFIAQGAQINVKAYGNIYCNGLAAQDFDIIKLLVEHGADVNANNGWPLRVAKDFKTVKYLVEHGADVNKGVDDKTPLIVQISHYIQDHPDRYKIVTYLLDHGADINKHSTSKSALSQAIKLNDIKMVQLLLQRGANVNQQLEPLSPLSIAAKQGNIKIAKLLLDHGADINLFDKGRHSTAIMHATEHPDMVKFLVEHGAAKTNRYNIQFYTLAYAVHSNQFKTVAYLLKKKFPTTVHSKNGGSSVVERAQTKEMVDFLVKKGVSVNKASPIHYASNPEVLEALIKHGANINALKNGYTPLMYFMIYPSDRWNMVRTLMKYHPNTRIKAHNGQTIYGDFRKNNATWREIDPRLIDYIKKHDKRLKKKK
jgi:ankyrin repeat protein